MSARQQHPALRPHENEHAFHLHSSVVLLTNPRITNREGWRWDTRQRQQPRRNREAHEWNRPVLPSGKECWSAQTPAPAPPRRRRDARSASALHSCSSVQF